MTILDDILDGTAATTPVVLPGLERPVRRLAVTDPVLAEPATRQEYLRVLFFVEVIGDSTPDAPFKVFMDGLKESCHKIAMSLANERFSIQLRARREELQREEELRLKGIFRSVQAAAPEESLERAATERARGIAEEVFRRRVAEGPSDDELKDAINVTAEVAGEHCGWLESQAEEVAYRLKVKSYPHPWLVARLLWEAQDFLERVKWRSRRPPPLGTFPNTVGATLGRPPWRRDPLPSKPRAGVPIFLFADETDAKHAQNINKALERVRAMRTVKRGRKPWDGDPPSDTILVRLLYANLRGESYQKLANNDPEVRGVHHKTLEHHLVIARREIFSEEE